MDKDIGQIEEFWQIRDKLTQDTLKIEQIKPVLDNIISALNQGLIRVCEKVNGEWLVNQWIKKAILLYFIVNDSQTYSGDCIRWYDKIPPKFSKDYNDLEFQAVGGRLISWDPFGVFVFVVIFVIFLSAYLFVFW